MLLPVEASAASKLISQPVPSPGGCEDFILRRIRMQGEGNRPAFNHLLEHHFDDIARRSANFFSHFGSLVHQFPFNPNPEYISHVSNVAQMITYCQTVISGS
jgi:hypothetical protein